MHGIISIIFLLLPKIVPVMQNNRSKSEKDKTLFTMCDRSETVPIMQPSVRNPPRSRHSFYAQNEHFLLKNATFRAPSIIPNFIEYCTCHEKSDFNFTKYCTYHQKWHLNSPNTAPATKSNAWTSPNAAPAIT